MAQERQLKTDFVPVELMDRIQRKLKRAYAVAEDEPNVAVTVTLKFSVKFDVQTGEAVGTYELWSGERDREAIECGRVRDGQMVLPGTEIRSDDPPTLDYQLPFSRTGTEG